MFYYCTLFDSNYLSRGLAMHASLQRSCKDFHLYMFAFDDTCYKLLCRLSLNNVTVIPLHEFEDENLLKIKPTRSPAEYCWTCTSAVILYCLTQFHLDHCTYIDADLYFFSDPNILVTEMGGKSVLITDHRYTKKYDLSATMGRYCVQFITFKNNEEGLTVLNWWNGACLEWCYARAEDGKFGDQKYLDDWTERFNGVHVLKNLGGGVAPWNVQQYDIFERASTLSGRDKKSKNTFEVVFYHFHGVRFYKEGIIGLNVYTLTAQQRKILYAPYIVMLENFKKMILQLDSSFNPHGIATDPPEILLGFQEHVKFYFKNIFSAFFQFIKAVLFYNLKNMISQSKNYYNINKFINKYGTSDKS